MFLPEFVPARFKTPEAQAGISELVTRAKATGAKKDRDVLIAVARSILDETVASAKAAPPEEVDLLVRSYLARWHERFGLPYDALDELPDEAWSSAQAATVMLDEDLLAFPLPDVFTVEGFPLPLHGAAPDAWATFNKDFRGVARDAWEAEQNARHSLD
ncbi:hypothetical protein [Mesorhizobium argentiipisi]|uniref:Uncharacterized protein n=1 Tax=Mesorhizobium argentiipisi TaxID=3015175 RepID=A0ABU8KLB5_9HYPH